MHGQPDFNESDADTLRAVLPHLTNAMLVRLKLEDVEYTARQQEATAMSIAERFTPTRRSLRISAPSESVLLAIVALGFLALHILSYYTLVRPALPEKPVDQFVRNGILAPAGVEVIEINLLGLEVFGVQTQGVALDAGVDVLGDEDDTMALLLEGHGAADDAVVGRVCGEAGAEFLIFLEDDADAAAGLRDGHAFGDVAGASQGVEVTDDGSGVAA